MRDGQSHASNLGSQLTGAPALVLPFAPGFRPLRAKAGIGERGRVTSTGAVPNQRLCRRSVSYGIVGAGLLAAWWFISITLYLVLLLTDPWSSIGVAFLAFSALSAIGLLGFGLGAAAIVTGVRAHSHAWIAGLPATAGGMLFTVAGSGQVTNLIANGG